MATILNRDLIRESTVKRKDKEVMVTLGKNQELTLKLKGVRGDKGVTICLGDLYDYLSDTDFKPKEGTETNPMISLHDLRSSFLTLDVPYKVTLDLERKTLRLIELIKNR